MTTESLPLIAPTALSMTGIIILTVLSGLADAQGFIHATAAFARPDTAWVHIARTFIFFIVGTISYLLAVRGLMRAGVQAPELHMLFWFAVTIVGMALMSGSVVDWSGADRLVGAGVVMGIAWLVWHAA